MVHNLYSEVAATTTKTTTTSDPHPKRLYCCQMISMNEIQLVFARFVAMLVTFSSATLLLVLLLVLHTRTSLMGGEGDRDRDSSSAPLLAPVWSTGDQWV